MAAKTLVIPDPTFYYSYKDENTFFNWIYEAPGFVQVIRKSDPEGLHFTFKKITPETLSELYAAMRRYGLDFKCLGPQITKTELRKIFARKNPEDAKSYYKFWAEEIYGASAKRKPKVKSKPKKAAKKPRKPKR